MDNKQASQSHTNKNKKYDVIIIGGGTAGLFCAYESSRKGLSVALIEHNEKLGAKLALAGGGMGNMTNRNINPDHYIGHDHKEREKLLLSLFKNFTCDDVINILDDFQIPFEERDFGQIFCLKPVHKFIGCLESACQNVDFFLGEHIERIYYDEPKTSADQNKPSQNDETYDDTKPNNLNSNNVNTDDNRNDSTKNTDDTNTDDSTKNDPTKNNPDTKNQPKEYHVELRNSKNTHIYADNLVLATGATAYPQIGASDFGLRLAKKWGHEVYDFSPVLVPFILPSNENAKRNNSEETLLGLEGISIPVSIRIQKKGKEYKDPCDVRSMLFTHKGLSGPAVLVASCFWEEGNSVKIDFLPNYSLQDAMHQVENGKKNLKNLLLPLLPDRLVYRLLPEVLQNRKVAELGKKERLHLINLFHNYNCIPEKTEGLKKAEATHGGVSIKCLKNHLESNTHKGLYFCGELIDITGLLGGYNIHFALATAKRIAHSL